MQGRRKPIPYLVISNDWSGLVAGRIRPRVSKEVIM